MPLPALVGVGAMLLRGGFTAATLAPLVKPAIGVAKRFLKRGTARPGIGSKVTRGSLKVGKQTIYGPARPGTGAVLRTAGAVAALGVGVGVTRRPQSRSAPQTRPQPARSTPRRAASKGTRKCCPVGTKRMVCFKRGRVKSKKKGSKRKFSAKQLANQRRFAAAARARRKKRG
jgi:hypothetical protein